MSGLPGEESWSSLQKPSRGEGVEIGWRSFCGLLKDAKIISRDSKSENSWGSICHFQKDLCVRRLFLLVIPFLWDLSSQETVVLLPMSPSRVENITFSSPKLVSDGMRIHQSFANMSQLRVPFKGKSIKKTVWWLLRGRCSWASSECCQLWVWGTKSSLILLKEEMGWRYDVTSAIEGCAVTPGINPLPGPPCLFYRYTLSHLWLSPVSLKQVSQAGVLMVSSGPREARTEHSLALGLHQGVGSKASSSWQRYRCFSTTHFLSLCPICEGVSGQWLIRSFNFLVWTALMFPSVYNMRFEIGKQGPLQFSCNYCYSCC